SLGLRYELTPPFTDKLGDYFTVALPKIGNVPNMPQSDWPYFVRQGNCTDPYAGLAIHWTQTNAVCGGGLNYNLMQTKYRNFAPRVGLSYALGDKTVIRTGWGVFYTQDIANSMYFDLARNIAARITLTSDTANPNLFWDNAVPGGNGAVAQVPPPYAYVAAYDHATSYTMQYLLNVQRQFGANWAVEVGYIGSESHHLYGFQNANQAVPGTTSLNSRLPFTNFGVIQLVADGFNAAYNSGSVKITRRFSQGLSLTSSYTLSKSIDNSSGIRVQGFDTLFPQNSACLRCERALSAFDTRNRFVLGGTYDLPVGNGKLMNIKNRVANVLAGGWQTSASATIQSGVPQTIIAGIDNASTGNSYDRPTLVPGSTGYAANRSPSRWFDPAAFVMPAAGTFGNVGRNTLITPHFQSVDFALHKQFHMPKSETHVVQFRAEAFNVLNHPSWGAPNGSIRAGAPFAGAPANAAWQGFGVISSTAIPMRQLQLALKYSF
ncbi:MAG TPA: hypothetical protein VKY31_07985, partial [Terriglobia bacterium]|nr:hypothetical protein [Terriglobia bacterium]